MTTNAVLSDRGGACVCVFVFDKSESAYFLKCPIHLTKLSRILCQLCQKTKTHGRRTLSRLQRADERNVMHIAHLKRPTLFHCTFLQIRAPLFLQKHNTVLLLKLVFFEALFLRYKRSITFSLCFHLNQFFCYHNSNYRRSVYE